MSELSGKCEISIWSSVLWREPKSVSYMNINEGMCKWYNKCIKLLTGLVYQNRFMSYNKIHKI